MKNKFAFLLAALLAAPAFAQVPAPSFIYQAATAYDAQILTATNGISLAVQATVSADHKYATLGNQSTLNGSPNFTPFTIAIPTGGGIVGSNAGPSLGGVAPTGPSVLDKPGMTLISPLQP